MTRRELSSLLVGAAVTVVFALAMLDVAYSAKARRDRAAAHPAGWVERTGAVVWVGSPDYSKGAPVLPSTVRYRDHAGVSHDVDVDMPVDTTHVGSQVDMSVDKDESVIVWNSADDKNQSNDYPYPGSRSNYDVGWGWAVGLLGGAVLGLGSGCLCLAAFDKLAGFGGRLGTR